MYPEIVEGQERLERLFGEVENLQGSGTLDDSLVAHFVWYLCIRTAGHIENSVQTILLRYVQSASDDRPTQRFAESRLQRISAKYGHITGLLGMFSSDWKSQVTDLVEDDMKRVPAALSNIVDNRNHIAHGRDSQITLQELKANFEDATRLLELLHRTCIPDSDYSSQI